MVSHENISHDNIYRNLSISEIFHMFKKQHEDFEREMKELEKEIALFRQMNDTNNFDECA